MACQVLQENADVAAVHAGLVTDNAFVAAKGVREAEEYGATV